VLIITGQDAHPWRQTSAFLREILNETGKFEVRVAEEFRDAGPGSFANYDVAVLVYSDEKFTNIPTWSDTTRKALLDFVRSGKGLVVYHHSAASFQNWPEYKSLVGCVWRSSQSHHAPVHDYQVDIRDGAHPVTAGMKPFQARTDELYAGLECDEKANMHVLATGWDDHSLYRGKQAAAVQATPSRAEPLIWTLSYGSGRVFANMLGNDMRAVHTAGFAATMVRGTEWAATGAVTIPLPAELAVPSK